MKAKIAKGMEQEDGKAFKKKKMSSMAKPAESSSEG